jgi:hypothetical protein
MNARGRRSAEGRAAKQKNRPKSVENFSQFKRAETKFPPDDVRRRRRRNERKRRVWKLLPDRKIFRGDSEPSESQHVSARFSHSSGLCPGDLIDGQSFPLPPSPDDLRYSSLLSFRFPQCDLYDQLTFARYCGARSTPMRASEPAHHHPSCGSQGDAAIANAISIPTVNVVLAAVLGGSD